jgi:hypothetical protein
MKIAVMASLVVMAWSATALASSNTRNRTFELFGKRYCLADAPAGSHCDYRFHQLSKAGSGNSHAQRVKSEAAAAGARFQIWGEEFCLGAAAGGPGCDRSFGEPSARNTGREFDFFGFHVCVGKKASTQHCDFSLPYSEKPHEANAHG